AGESCAGSADPRRSGDVRAGISALAEGHGRQHLPLAPAPRALGRPAARADHGRDQALRRARAAVLPGELSEGAGHRSAPDTGLVERRTSSYFKPCTGGIFAEMRATV